MSVKTFLRITAATTTVIGLLFILTPFAFTKFFLPSPDHAGLIFVRFLGSSLIGYSYLNWHTAMYADYSVIKPTLIGNFSTLCIALVLSIVAVLAGALSSWGWLIVLLHLVFAIGFGYFLFGFTEKSLSKYQD